VWLLGAAGPSARAATATAERSGKDYQPNIELVTHEGKSVRFYDDLIQGRVVLINMMFTSCTNICPPMTANLLKVQRLLSERLAGPSGPKLGKELLMLSVSVDPETDTPAVLKRYAAKNQVGPGWLFLTGTRHNIDALLAKLGSQDPDINRHSGMLLVGNDATRSWRKVFAMAEPSELVAAVLQLLSPPGSPSPAGPAPPPAAADRAPSPR
jgi:protein SCO1/2